MSFISEADWEYWALDVLGELGWQHRDGSAVAPGTGERSSWRDLVLENTLLRALRNLNPEVPEQYLRQAIAEVTTPQSQDAITENYRIHQILVNGYRGIVYIDDATGTEQNPTIRFISADPSRNIAEAINQVTIRSREHERRFDIVLYLNGLPVSFIELKQAGSKNATAEQAYNQLRTYLSEFPMAFRFAAFVVATDGITAKYGTPFTPWNHFAPWNVDDDGSLLAALEVDADGRAGTQFETTLHGLYNEERFGQLMREFIAFDEDASGLTKRITKPHQYFAVSKAVGKTAYAMRHDGRAGVVWHTQGSGKSMEMELFTAKVLRDPAFANPTVVVITDRTELDTQLFDSFAKSTLLPEHPQSVNSRAELRNELAERRTGGIYFTTLQKFGLTATERELGAEHPMLSDRRNIIVVVDEAHRSHYDSLDGYASHLRSALPHATLIAFTGTPIAEGERDTRRVFGDDIDVYDLYRAVEDGATVPVAFEPRLIQVARAEGMDDDKLDDAAEEATSGLDEADRKRLERKILALETLYGAPERIKVLAADIVAHWEQRREAMQQFISCPGKGMIVCATRSIAAQLYEEIVKLRPDWHDDADDKGRIKVVYTGQPTDPPEITKHLRRPSAIAAVKNRMKDPDDELELIIVKDMMLTGFDAPALHTLYVDRPLRGALLMQTLARVNRTFRGKEDGLLVAYAPLTDNLQEALSEFTRPGPDGNRPTFPGKTADEALELLTKTLAKLDEITGAQWRSDIEQVGHQQAVLRTVSHLRSPATPGNRVEGDPEARPLATQFHTWSARMARAWALTASNPDAEQYRGAARFYEEVRVWMAKLDAQERVARGEPIPEEVSRLLGNLVVTSTTSEGVIDIYREANVELPDLSQLTPEWVADAAQPSKAQLAIEALKARILENSREATRGNEVAAAKFSERVNNLMIRYTNQQLTNAEVLAALVELSKEVVAEASRGQQFSPPLSADELAFHDLLALNESAITELGDDTLAAIARDIVATMRRDTRTDWTVRADVKAKLRATVRRLLRKYNYPPDKTVEAIKAVISHMENIAPRFAEEQGCAEAGDR